MRRPFRFVMLALASGALSLPVGLQATPASAQKAEKGAKDAASKKAPAKSAEAAPASPAASAWAVSCSDRGQAAFKCEMTQTLIDDKTRSALVVLSVTHSEAATNLVMRMPHGVYLPAGLNLKIDQGEARKLAFQRSDAAGVYAGLPLDEKTIAVMGQGHVLSLGMELAPGKPIEFPARLEGFAPALQRLVSTK